MLKMFQKLPPPAARPVLKSKPRYAPRTKLPFVLMLPFNLKIKVKNLGFDLILIETHVKSFNSNSIFSNSHKNQIAV